MPLQEWSAAQDVRHEVRVVNARPVPAGFAYSLASRSHFRRNSGGGAAAATRPRRGSGEGGGGEGGGGEDGGGGEIDAQGVCT